ncbi:MAG: hypothetical protein M3R17_08605 [Bacteroidota bacterium]|nr:hypothetical protein [Bacteroidota bacterium]
MKKLLRPWSLVMVLVLSLFLLFLIWVSMIIVADNGLLNSMGEGMFIAIYVFVYATLFTSFAAVLALLYVGIRKVVNRRITSV